MERDNQLTLNGRLTERNALRHTPAGVAIVDFRIAHASEQSEAGTARKVELDLACMAVQEQARLVAQAPLGIGMQLTGFLAPKSRSSRQLVLHVNTIEFKEGINDAPTKQRP